MYLKINIFKIKTFQVCQELQAVLFRHTGAHIQRDPLLDEISIAGREKTQRV